MKNYIQFKLLLVMILFGQSVVYGMEPSSSGSNQTNVPSASLDSSKGMTQENIPSTTKTYSSKMPSTSKSLLAVSILGLSASLVAKYYLFPKYRSLPANYRVANNCVMGVSTFTTLALLLQNKLSGGVSRKTPEQSNVSSSSDDDKKSGVPSTAVLTFADEAVEEVKRREKKRNADGACNQSPQVIEMLARINEVEKTAEALGVATSNLVVTAADKSLQNIELTAQMDAVEKAADAVAAAATAAASSTSVDAILTQNQNILDGAETDDEYSSDDQQDASEKITNNDNNTIQKPKPVSYLDVWSRMIYSILG